MSTGAVIASLSNAREGRVCWHHALAFTAGGLPGMLANIRLGQAVSGSALTASFATIVLIAAAST